MLARCLAKDPDHRWQSAADLAVELHWIGEERARPSVEPRAAVDRRPPTRERIWMGVAAAAVLSLAVVAYRWYPRPAPLPGPVTFAIEAPDGETLSPGQGLMAISPDGSRVAFTTGLAEGTRLWIRTMERLDPVRLERADGTFQPAWSPDGRRVQVSTAGGANPRWTGDGRRIIYRDPQGAVLSVECTVTGGAFHASMPVELFRMPRVNGPGAVMFGMDRNAERFLIVQGPERGEEAASRSITVVLNFLPSLKPRTATAQ